MTTAADAHTTGYGVCRDFTHLAVSFCRALNIPARYVFGYLPEIDNQTRDLPMDFAAWMEVYLGDRWRVSTAGDERCKGRVSSAWPRCQRCCDGDYLWRASTGVDDRDLGRSRRGLAGPMVGSKPSVRGPSTGSGRCFEFGGALDQLARRPRTALASTASSCAFRRARHRRRSPSLGHRVPREDHVISCDFDIGSVDGDLTVDQPSTPAVDAQAFAADVCPRWHVWAVHVADDHALHQALDRVPCVTNEAILAAQLADGELRDPGWVLAHREGLLAHVVGETEPRLDYGSLERWLRLERQIPAVYPIVAGMPGPLIRVSLRTGLPWGRAGVAEGVAVDVGVRLGEESSVPLAVAAGSGLPTTDRRLPTRTADATTTPMRRLAHR